MLRTDLKFLLDKYLDKNFLKQQNIFKEKEVKKYLNLFLLGKNIELNGIYVNKLIWNLLVFQMWYKKYME